MYSYSQLELYTDRFDPVPLDDGGRFLGRGGYGEVYLGNYNYTTRIVHSVADLR